MINEIKKQCKKRNVWEVDVFIADNKEDMAILIGDRNRNYQRRNHVNHLKWLDDAIKNDELNGVFVNDNLFINYKA